MVSIVRYWRRQFSAIRPPFFHECDCDTLMRHAHDSYTAGRLTSRTYGRFAERLAPSCRERFVHLSLLPAPYAGDLNRADIFIMMLNPGFDPSDYVAEERRDFRTTLRRAITQDQLHQAAYPYHFLNPAFYWHSGAKWLLHERQLEETLRLAAERRRETFSAIRQEASRRIAVLELVAYHTEKSVAGRLANRLPSSKAIVEFVQNELRPRAGIGARHILLFAARRARQWGFRPGDEDKASIICNFDSGSARSAYMNPRSKGGRAILRRLIGERSYRQWEQENS